MVIRLEAFELLSWKRMMIYGSCLYKLDQIVFLIIFFGVLPLLAVFIIFGFLPSSGHSYPSSF
jgi:hypothetical protein